MFCEDFTNAKVFDQLEKRIQQKEMSQSLCDDISKDFVYITDVTQALSLLDVTIGYLVSVDGDGNMFLADYLETNLRMNRQVPSEIVRNHKTVPNVGFLQGVAKLFFTST